MDSPRVVSEHPKDIKTNLLACCVGAVTKIHLRCMVAHCLNHVSNQGISY